MAEELEKELQDLDPEEQKKLKKLLEKDAKSFRTPTGFWKWTVGASRRRRWSCFISMPPALKAVATQYHRGVYVFITYVLVFLVYPAGQEMHSLAALAASRRDDLFAPLAIFFFYEDAAAFRARLGEFGSAWSDQGVAAALALRRSVAVLVLGAFGHDGGADCRSTA